MVYGSKRCKCGCDMQRHSLPPLLVINGEVMVPDDETSDLTVWFCPCCSRTKLSRLYRKP